MIRATPFHIRSAAANRDNAWINRNGVTLSRVHSRVEEEAAAARNACVIADISWRWRVRLEGPRAAEFLSRLTTRDAAALAPGTAHKALWLNDAGGVRGTGVVARYGREAFLLAAAAADEAWIGSAAARYGIALHAADGGGLALIGPYARSVVESAGLDPTGEPLAFRKLFWRGLDVTLSRWGEHGGYEIWCDEDDGVAVWDRIVRAGADFALRPAGTAAVDVLDMEAGVARPERDYQPADTDGDPSPKLLGLESLIDPAHNAFNGCRAWLAASPSERLAGIAFESDIPVADARTFRDGRAVGRMLSSLYSPALRRAIGFARLESAACVPGTRLSLFTGADNIAVSLIVADLPFLASSAPIDP